MLTDFYKHQIQICPPFCENFNKKFEAKIKL